MRKIISTLLMFCMLFILVGCTTQNSTETPISENSFITKLPFEVITDAIQDTATAMQFLSVEASQKLGLSAYLMTNNDILLTNDLDGKSNPTEDLTYSTETNSRTLKYRYLCKDEFDKFNKEHVKKQIKTIFDINLDDYNFDEVVNGLIEKTSDLKDNTVFPTRIDTGNDIDIIVGIAKTEQGTFLSVVGTYQTIEIVDEH